MTCSPEALSALIARIYDCAGGQEDWAPMLADLARFMGAERSLLFSLAPRPEHERLWVGHEVPPEALAEYGEYYHEHDVLLQTAMEQSRFHAGRAIADETLMPKRCFRSSEYYQDFFRRMGILHTCSGIVFDQDAPAGIPPALLVFYRGPERPAFTPKDEHLVELFIPHLQRAVQIAVQIDGARMLSAVRDRMFEASPYGMAVCSRDGRLLYANARMERILEAQDGLAYREGRITVSRERDRTPSCGRSRPVPRRRPSPRPARTRSASTAPRTRPLTRSACTACPPGTACSVSGSKRWLASRSPIPPRTRAIAPSHCDVSMA